MLDVAMDDTLRGKLLASAKGTSESGKQVSSSEDKDESTLWVAKCPFHVEFLVLFQRTAKNIIRNASLAATSVGIALALGLLGGLLFSDVTLDLAGFQNRTGAFYFMLTFFGFSSFSAMDNIISERYLYVKETGKCSQHQYEYHCLLRMAEIHGRLCLGLRYHNVFAYFICKVVIEAVILRIVPVILFSW